jgi:hypothetical protein
MTSVSEPPRPRRRSIRELFERRANRNTLLAQILDNWMTIVRQQRLGPGFGLVDEIRGQDLLDAVPEFDPPPKILPSDEPDQDIYHYNFEEGASEERRRVSLWAVAIATSPELARRSSKARPKPLFSTVGLVSTRTGVRLAVVDYYPPSRLLLAPRPSSVGVGGANFPIFARPWIPEPHSGSQIHDGHCWVEVDSEHGILTARHVIRPPNATVGSTVSIATKRKEVRGELTHTSQLLDVAVIKVTNLNSSPVGPYPFSSTVGFKRVRYITGDTQVEADITGMSGFQDAYYFKGSGGNEPLAPALMTLSRPLDHGDSGCLVIDIESESYGHTHPYLIYQGACNLGKGLQGYGIFIAQVANEWALSTCYVAPGA